MKNILLSSICFLASIFSTQAQTLYCPTLFNDDNQESPGLIVKFIPATNTLTVAHSFEETDDDPCTANGQNPSGSLVQAKNGKFYGVTPKGGNGGGCQNGYGVIYSFDPSSSTYKKLHDFDKVNGWGPQGSLM